jgi:thiol:disulfide interchange protein DsbC
MTCFPFLALTIALLPSLAGAATPEETRVRQMVEARFSVKVDDVAKTAYGSLFEVRMGEEIVYTDEKVSYLLVGNLIDARTRENVTETRKEKLATINFDELPLDAAIKTVRGNGKVALAVFADPNCGFCKRMERELSTLNDVTIYTFLYPILDPSTNGDSMRKSKAIWCARDRSKAWFDLMIKGVSPIMMGNCDTSAVEKNVALGQKLGINGTPTSFLRSGQRIIGARSTEIRKAVELAKN